MRLIPKSPRQRGLRLIVSNRVAVAFVIGFFYFAAITSVSTVFQSQLDHEIRGRASAVWLMAALGTAPIANLLGGWLISITSITAVMLGGAAISLGIAWYADLRPAEQQHTQYETITMAS